MSMFANLTRTRYIPKAKDTDSQTIYAVAGTDSKGRVTLGKAYALTTQAFFDDNTSVVNLNSLLYFKNVKGLPTITKDGTYNYGKSNYSSLEKICGKWIKGTNKPFSKFTSLRRLVLVNPYGGTEITEPHWEDMRQSCELIDLGIGTYGMQNSINMCTKTDGNIILRNTLVVPKVQCSSDSSPAMSDDVCKYIFVPYELLDNYKGTKCYEGFEDKFYPIGGLKWKEIFGSTDPYADLTAEEKKWYTDLFPHLYDNWVAPTNDGIVYQAADFEGNVLADVDGNILTITQ